MRRTFDAIDELGAGNFYYIPEKYIPENSSLDIQLPLENKIDARRVFFLVAIVNHFKKPVELDIHGESCNARNITQVIKLFGENVGVEEITFRGADDVLKHIQLLFASDPTEVGFHGLPYKLSYLKNEMRIAREW